MTLDEARKIVRGVASADCIAHAYAHDEHGDVILDTDYLELNDVALTADQLEALAIVMRADYTGNPPSAPHI